ncbi:MAG: hypothetical protein JSV73_08410 [Flavobacteriaceae bacterium]|nr:MAG: hypothetical protein JSV73_08410 [Flavobacteriaceae bacterium]
MLIPIILAAFIITLIGYLIFREPDKSNLNESDLISKKPEKHALPRMANLPPKKIARELPPPPSYQPDAQGLEQARSALREGITPEDAVVLARSLPESPERADAAFLLLEYAADLGNAAAADLVARYYDPTDETPSGTIRKNPKIAYEWYKKASDVGQDTQIELNRLHRWVEAQAKQGSKEARLLLENWH